jgi:hypothetical protein
MRHRWALAGILLVAPACAAILGIEDGVPREDAGIDATVDQGAPDVSDDADGALEAEAAPPPLTVPCGDAAACVVGQTTCCRKGTNPNFTYGCVSDAAACTGTNPKLIPCNRAEVCAALDAGASDAGPAVCCADSLTTDAGTSLTKVFCTSQATCLGTGFVMCPVASTQDAGSVEAGCVSPRLCRPSTIVIPGYLICQ